MKPAHQKRKVAAPKPQGKSNRHNSEDFALLWPDAATLENTTDKKAGRSTCKLITVFPQSQMTRRPQNITKEKAEQNQQLQ